MLKGIPRILSPELLKILCEMGHGDELLLADGNYPCHSNHDRVIRADGNAVAPMLEAILELMPLDCVAEHCVFSMATDDGSTPAILDCYYDVLIRHGFQGEILPMERFAFYERSKKTYCIVATGEGSLYGNLIIKKGTV